MAPGSGGLKRVLAGSRRLRVGLAIVLVVVLLAAGILQLLPLLERKAHVQAAETTTGTVEKAEQFRNQYEFSYTYTVDGRTYESTRVFVGPYAPRGKASPEALAQLPNVEPGESTTVYYLPAEPGYAWLATQEQVVSRHVVYFVAAGIGAVLLVAFIYVDLRLPKVRAAAGNAGHGGLEAAQFREMAEMFDDVDPQNPPSEAEMRERLSERMPEQGSQEPNPAQSQPPSPAGGSAGFLGTLGQVLGLLKVAAVIVLLGIVAVVGSGFVLLQFLTP